jgi:hypothetical protein
VSHDLGARVRTVFRVAHNTPSNLNLELLCQGIDPIERSHELKGMNLPETALMEFLTQSKESRGVMKRPVNQEDRR